MTIKSNETKSENQDIKALVEKTLEPGKLFKIKEEHLPSWGDDVELNREEVAGMIAIWWNENSSRLGSGEPDDYYPIIVYENMEEFVTALCSQLYVVEPENEPEVKIDWNDFKKWLCEMAAGSGSQDQKYFETLVDKCGAMIMTEELKIWYDNGNYRKDNNS